MWPLLLFWAFAAASMSTLASAWKMLDEVLQRYSTDASFGASPSSPIDWELLELELKLASALSVEDYQGAKVIEGQMRLVEHCRTEELASKLLHSSNLMRAKARKEQEARHGEQADKGAQRLLALIEAACAEQVSA